nr:neuroligin-1-like [Procambarus clarkii]
MWPRETVTVALCLGAVLSTLLVTTASEPHRKTPIITTKYGQLRGFYRPVTGYGIQVATYLGVPYATPPVGANRFSPTRTLSQWVGVHEATHFGPACPQRLPDISNETAALSRMSRGRLQALKRYLPALRRQSEDCLYLNLYVPVEDRPAAAYPVAVFVHGESYEWGASSLYDGSVLAALGRVIVVTINYRLGILGFFNPNVDPVGRATVANYGLMDQLAALHWVQENIVRFGGDPGHVTVMGHSTGAACLNFLVISPAAAGAGLFKRAILMSGSALSSWAAVQEPVYYAVQAARQLGCQVPDDLYRHYEALLHCLRDRTVDQILQVELETPQFLSSIGPSVDGVTIRPDWKEQHTKMGEEGRTPVDLLLGVAATDILEVFSDAEIQHGFEADHRDRLLRTFVTNNYRYHLQEIVLAITAEYTDWARPVQHPVHIRDLTAEALHDAAFVFPVTVAANQLYTPARTAFLYVLDYRPDEPDPEVRVAQDSTIHLHSDCSSVVHCLNRGGLFSPWLFEASSRGRVRDHYRAGRVALWSWLVPGLEKVGSLYGLDSAFHKFPDYEKSDSYSGPTRPSNLSSNLLPPFTTVAPSSPATITTAKHNTQPPTVLVLANSSNVAGLMEDVLRGQQQQQQQQQGHFPYTTALSLTVAIGCSLLVLNLIVFAAVYYRRDTYRHAHSKPGGPINHESSMNETGNGVQLRNTGDNFGKPSSPSHCGTLRSSSTLRSSLATSCDGEPQHEWPPDYSSCCQSGQGSAGSGLSPGHDVANTRPPHNGTVRSVARPPPPPRSSSYPSHVEAQPLLSPSALLQISNAACSEMRA